MADVPLIPPTSQVSKDACINAVYEAFKSRQYIAFCYQESQISMQDEVKFESVLKGIRRFYKESASNSVAPRVTIEERLPEERISTEANSFRNIFALPSGRESDIDYVMARRESVPQTYHKQAFRSLFWNAEFSSWIFDRKSRKLEVKAGFRETILDATPEYSKHISQMSVLCSKMYLALEPCKGVYCLYFCCGLHRNPSEHSSGGKGLIMSLLVQLRRQHDFTSGWVNEDLLQRAAQNDLEALCDLFLGYVRQLPRKSILFCLIDGAEHYGEQDFQYDFRMVVVKLARMVEYERRLCCMKLLIVYTKDQPLEYLAFNGNSYIQWDRASGKYVCPSSCD